MSSIKFRFAAFGFLLGTLLGGEHGALAAIPNFGLQNNTVTSDDPLTNQKIWGLDPTEPNPAQRKWILRRELKLTGLKAVESEQHTFKVRVDGITASTTKYFRGAGPWFRGPDEYPCQATAASTFATREGAEIAAEESAKIWGDLLARDKVKLALIFSRISGKTEDSVLSSALDLFDRWQIALTEDWRALSNKRAHDAEWTFYRKSFARGCTQGHASTHAAFPKFEEVIEAPPAAPTGSLVVRAPARRWNGAYSIRVTVTVDEKKLVGQFLIDSGYPKSVISPTFLESQGVYTGAVLVPYAQPERIGKILARPAKVDQVEISNAMMPIDEFLLAQTDFYSPPDTMASCCDGVIGNDLLRKFAVRFNGLSAKMSEVDFYSRQNFRPEGDFIWKEVSLTDSKLQPVSHCQIADEKSVHSSEIEWDTVSPEPFRVLSALGIAKTVSLHCSGDPIVSAVRPEVDPQVAQSVIGIDVLDRGDFAFDLSNGRIWLQKPALLKPIHQNQTGLELVFDLGAHNARILKVAEIKKTHFSEPLLKAGLHLGTQITSINGKPVDEMDSWIVDQSLSGAFSDQVMLVWGAGKSAKQVSMTVR